MAQRLVEVLPSGASRYYDPATNETVNTSCAVNDRDDFTGIVLNATNDYAVAGANSGTAAINEIVGGAVRLTTGAADDNCTEVATAIVYKGDKNPGFEVRYRQNDVDQTSVFFGLTDAKTESGAVLPMNFATTTLTSTATDAFGFLQDSDATTDAIRFVGVDTNTDSAILTSAATLGDSTWHVVRAQVNSAAGTCEAFVDGVSLGSIAVPTDVALTFYMGLRNHEAFVNTLDVDYRHVWQDR